MHTPRRTSNRRAPRAPCIVVSHMACALLFWGAVLGGGAVAKVVAMVELGNTYTALRGVARVEVDMWGWRGVKWLVALWCDGV